MARCELRCLISENVYRPSATHISPKLAACDVANGSPKRSVPIMSIVVGAMYWRNPTLLSGIRRAAAPNRKSGITVKTPAPVSRIVVTGFPDANAA